MWNRDGAGVMLTTPKHGAVMMVRDDAPRIEPEFSEPESPYWATPWQSFKRYWFRPQGFELLWRSTNAGFFIAPPSERYQEPAWAARKKTQAAVATPAKPRGLSTEGPHKMPGTRWDKPGIERIGVSGTLWCLEEAWERASHPWDRYSLTEE
jgi:hypothetical protein